MDIGDDDTYLFIQAVVSKWCHCGWQLPVEIFSSNLHRTQYWKHWEWKSTSQPFNKWTCFFCLAIYHFLELPVANMFLWKSIVSRIKEDIVLGVGEPGWHLGSLHLVNLCHVFQDVIIWDMWSFMIEESLPQWTQPPQWGSLEESQFHPCGSSFKIS